MSFEQGLVMSVSKKFSIVSRQTWVINKYPGLSAKKFDLSKMQLDKTRLSVHQPVLLTDKYSS